MKKIIFGTAAVILLAGAIAFASGHVLCKDSDKCEKCQICCEDGSCCKKNK